MGRAILGLVCVCSVSCVDVFRGAVVQMNLTEGQVEVSEAGEHYELFAVVNGGLVSLERFKVFDSVDGCLGDPETTPRTMLVQRYDAGASLEALCDSGRRLGNVDRIDTTTLTLVGGVRIETPVDLSMVERLFVTVEPDGETDPAPARVVAGADMADGIAPQAVRTVECTRKFCDALDPADPNFELFCAERPTVPRVRRGVRLGVFVQEPVPVGECATPVEVGDVAVVPAEDGTFW